MQMSLSIPLVMLDAPLWVTLLAPLLVYTPLLIYSMAYTTLLLCAYDIVRPALYVWALVVTICGVQDFFAIAFYIIVALQIFSIIKRFIGTIGIIIIALTEKK